MKKHIIADIYIDKPLLCHSLQCYHCLFFNQHVSIYSTRSISLPFNFTRLGNFSPIGLLFKTFGQHLFALFDVSLLGLKSFFDVSHREWKNYLDQDVYVFFTFLQLGDFFQTFWQHCFICPPQNSTLACGVV